MVWQPSESSNAACVLCRSPRQRWQLAGRVERAQRFQAGDRHRLCLPNRSANRWTPQGSRATQTSTKRFVVWEPIQPHAQHQGADEHDGGVRIHRLARQHQHTEEHHARGDRTISFHAVENRRFVTIACDKCCTTSSQSKARSPGRKKLGIDFEKPIQSPITTNDPALTSTI